MLFGLVHQNLTPEIDVFCLMFDRVLSISSYTVSRTATASNASISGVEFAWTTLYLVLVVHNSDEQPKIMRTYRSLPFLQCSDISALDI